MKLIATVTIWAATLSLLGCSSKPDIEVTISPNQYWGPLVFNVQSTGDSATVKGVRINRGNCPLPAGTSKDLERTVKLGFGNSYQGFSPSCKVNDVKEIEVTTDAGTFTFHF